MELGPLTDTSKFQTKLDSKFEESGVLMSKSRSKNRLEELGFVTNSFLSLKNLEK